MRGTPERGSLKRTHRLVNAEGEGGERQLFLTCFAKSVEEGEEREEFWSGSTHYISVSFVTRKTQTITRTRVKVCLG